MSQVPSDRRRNTSDDRPCISSRLPIGSVPVSVQSDVYRATPSTSMNCSRRDTSAGFSAMKPALVSRRGQFIEGDGGTEENTPELQPLTYFLCRLLLLKKKKKKQRY